MIYNYSPLHPFMYRQQHSLLWYLRLRTQVMPQLNSTRQGHALLVLIPNSTVNCVITYTITGVDIKYGQKSIVDSVSYTTGSCKMMFHKSHLICICLLRPLQVVIQFLVRASPKSRGGRAGLVIMSLFHINIKTAHRPVQMDSTVERNHKYCVRLALRPGFNINK